MAIFRGTTSTTAESAVFDIHSYVMVYSFTNNTAGAITITAGVTDETPTTFKFLSISVPANATEIFDIPIKIKSGDKISLTASGSCDYYIIIE